MRLRLAKLMVLLVAGFVAVTRPDGSTAWISSGWVQDVAPARTNDGTGCHPRAKTVVRMSGQVICVLDEPMDVADKMIAAEKAK